MTKYDLLLFGALFWNIYQLVFKGSKTGQSQIVLAIIPLILTTLVLEPLAIHGILMMEILQQILIHLINII